MEWTTELYERIRHLLPKQRGNVEIDNLTFLQALQYMVENGCRWRALPEKFGNWNTILLPVSLLAALSKNLQWAKCVKYCVSSSRLLFAPFAFRAKEH